MGILFNLSPAIPVLSLESNRWTFPKARAPQALPARSSALPAAAAARSAATYWSCPPLWRRESSRAGPWHLLPYLPPPPRFCVHTSSESCRSGCRPWRNCLFCCGSERQSGSERQAPPPGPGPAPPGPAPPAAPLRCGSPGPARSLRCLPAGRLSPRQLPRLPFLFLLLQEGWALKKRGSIWPP